MASFNLHSLSPGLIIYQTMLLLPISSLSGSCCGVPANPVSQETGSYDQKFLPNGGCSKPTRKVLPYLQTANRISQTRSHFPTGARSNPIDFPQRALSFQSLFPLTSLIPVLIPMGTSSSPGIPTIEMSSSSGCFLIFFQNQMPNPTNASTATPAITAPAIIALFRPTSSASEEEGLAM